MTTLKDLRVHHRPENGLPKQIKQRPVTLSDLREVLEGLGAERQWSCAASPSRTVPCDKRHGWQTEDNPGCRWVLVIPVDALEET